MAKSKIKPNSYEGTATFYVNGELITDQKCISRLVTIGLIRGMISIQNKGLMDLGIAGWEYTGLDYENMKSEEV